MSDFLIDDGEELVQFSSNAGGVITTTRETAQKLSDQGKGSIVDNRPLPTDTAMAFSRDVDPSEFSVRDVQRTPPGLDAPLAATPAAPLDAPPPPTLPVPAAPTLSPGEVGASENLVDPFPQAQEGLQQPPGELVDPFQGPGTPAAPTAPTGPVRGPSEPAAVPSDIPTASQLLENVPTTGQIQGQTGPRIPTPDEQLLTNTQEAENRLMRTQQAAEILRANGLDTEAETLEQSITDTDEFISARDERIREQRQENEAQQADKRARIEKLEGEIEATDIGDNRSIGERLLAGLMIGLFQAGSTIAGAPGTPNLAMKLINGSIKRDIDEQKRKFGTLKTSLAGAKSDLEKLVDATGSLDAAEAKLEQLRLGQVQRKLAALRARTGSAAAKNNADRMSQELDVAREQAKLKARNAQIAAEQKEQQRRQAAAAALGKERRGQQFELKKIALQNAMKQQQEASKLGHQFEGDVGALEQEYYKRGIDENEQIGRELFRLLGVSGNNPQNLMNKIKSVSVMKKFLSEDQGRALALQKTVQSLMAKQLLRGVATDADQKRVNEALATSAFANPETFQKQVESFLRTNERNKQSLFAGRDPRVVGVFKERLRRGFQQVEQDPSLKRAKTLRKR